VIGADEYHEYVSNNAFTNRIVQWHLEKALAVYDWLYRTPDRACRTGEELQLTSKQRSRWQDIVNNDSTTSQPLIEQYEEFFNLEDINLADYEPRTPLYASDSGINGANKRQVLAAGCVDVSI